MAATGELIELAAAASAAAQHMPLAPAAVCLGGGADSAVAAWAVAQRRDGVRCLFVDHGLQHSTLLRDAADKVAATVGLSLEVLDGRVTDGPNLEARARSARRQILLEAAIETESLVLGHSADDQAETVLLNLMRGAGGRGLSGMRRLDPPWVRPLLSFARRDLRRLAEHLSLPFADDPSNLDRRHSRNRVRLDLIPQLELDFNPGVTGILAATADRLAADEEALAAEAEVVPISQEWGAVLIPRALLTTLPEAVAVRAVRRGLRTLLDPYAGTSSDVAAVMAVATSGGRSQLARRLTAVAEGPYVAIHAGAPQPPEPGRLAIGGMLRWGDWSLEAHPARRRSRVPQRSIHLDVAAIGSDLVVRAWTAGDRIDIGSGTKPVAEVLREGGVPPRLRPVWPVVWVGGKIAAVAGRRPAAWAAATGQDSVELTLEKGVV